jgi:hypothetical protein
MDYGPSVPRNPDTVGALGAAAIANTIFSLIFP